MITTRTYIPTTRTPKGMQPMLRPAMSFICDICGNARVKGNHDQCSKTRQAAGFITMRGRNS
ncbi:hypothetical protein LU640_14055 [Pseudomonas monteilii]|uniref:hypothetical protein n=1 Tax=Pseudomonas monteilii TaxID=76759 RepID=UPI001E52E674|nr:hypothetical protein [Pseudomonas monteilii]MCE1019465.1 hypothetical protein [Pseudomonas monteilii]MCE1035619.1 hypothetical protein [Pseudomonas monteilii]MCE1087772.1 hypothetical protein [Pseudomonas monteilii]